MVEVRVRVVAAVVVFVVIGMFVCAAPVARGDAATPASGSGDKVKAGEDPERRATQLELEVERVVPLRRFSGMATVVDNDPRFVVEGTVKWVERPGVVALHSRRAFAIHSPTRLGLSGWQRGATICLLLTRIRDGGRTRWTLGATVPDAGCRGGG
jgi:hypothetical protein